MNAGGQSGNVFLHNAVNSSHSEQLGGGGLNNHNGNNGLANVVVNTNVETNMNMESVLADQRSRHNSAESEPPMSMRVSPNCVGPSSIGGLGLGATNMEINVR